jgi:hypothetical protein
MMCAGDPGGATGAAAAGANGAGRDSGSMAGADGSCGMLGLSPVPPPIALLPEGSWGAGPGLTRGISGATRCAATRVGPTANSATKSAATGKDQRPRAIEP